MATHEPRTNNPGLGNYVGRTVGAAIFLAVVFLFTGVHFYYATSALLDLVALLILFFFLFSLGLSLGCLALCMTVGPGELPSRFTAARMETFIREELQRVVAKAHKRLFSPSQTEASIPVERFVVGEASTTATVNGTASLPATKGVISQDRLRELDEAEGRQLANAASAAALTQRTSASAAAAELEERAVEARLQVHEPANVAVSNSDTDDEGRRKDGEDDVQIRGAAHAHYQYSGDGALAVQQEDGPIPTNEEEAASQDAPELPAYMPDMMRLRRQRKIRRGLDIVHVSDAALKVLQAIDGENLDCKQEEMSYLIPGANWCRFCNFYQMDDTRHCTACGRCVYRSKLHCVCCGQCIGYQNSKYYVLFLFYLCLAFIMANFLDIFCVSWGYTYFFKPTGESNSIYYLVFVYSYAFAVVSASLLAQYLYAAGRNVGLLTDLLRQQRAEVESVQVRNSGHLYQPITAERTAAIHDDGNSSPDLPPEPFQWTRAMNSIGEGLPFLLWLWPTPTRPVVKETDDPPGFWTNLKEAIRLRLRSVADEDDAFSDEEGVADHTEAAEAEGRHGPLASSGDSSAAVSSSAAAVTPPSTTGLARSATPAATPPAAKVAPVAAKKHEA